MKVSRSTMLKEAAWIMPAVKKKIGNVAGKTVSGAKRYYKNLTGESVKNMEHSLGVDEMLHNHKLDMYVNGHSSFTGLSASADNIANKRKELLRLKAARDSARLNTAIAGSAITGLSAASAYHRSKKEQENKEA